MSQINKKRQGFLLIYTKWYNICKPKILSRNISKLIFKIKYLFHDNKCRFHSLPRLVCYTSY